MHHARPFCIAIASWQSRRLPFGLLTIVLAATIASCEQYDCLQDVPHGPFVEVTVLDASTGRAAGDSVQGYLQNGDYLDKLAVCRIDDQGVAISLCGGFKASGVYTIVLNKAGYEQWTLDDVRVPVERCGLGVAAVTAELERL